MPKRSKTVFLSIHRSSNRPTITVDHRPTTNDRTIERAKSKSQKANFPIDNTCLAIKCDRSLADEIIIFRFFSLESTHSLFDHFLRCSIGVFVSNDSSKLNRRFSHSHWLSIDVVFFLSYFFLFFFSFYYFFFFFPFHSFWLLRKYHILINNNY